jgi:hypothetical protein
MESEQDSLSARAIAPWNRHFRPHLERIFGENTVFVEIAVFLVLLAASVALFVSGLSDL